MKFKEIPVDNYTLSRRRTVFGIGINDAKYKTFNNSMYCPYYVKWRNMLNRCYNDNNKNKPTYSGCTVCGEWLLFSNFKNWMTNQDWQGKHLDKDIINQGNKIYSPGDCVFVTQSINNPLTDNKRVNKEYPQGVFFNNKSGKYITTASVDGKTVHLGVFNDINGAALAYLSHKIEVISKIILTQSDERIAKGLSNHVANYRLRSRAFL